MENESNVSEEVSQDQQVIHEDSQNTVENKGRRKNDIGTNTANMRHKIENLEREKAELLDAKKLSQMTAQQLQEVSKKLSTVEAALGLYVSCDGYQNVVTPEAEKKYAEKYPATYALMKKSGDQYLIGASLYENITKNMYTDSEKNDTDQRIQENKKNLQLGPENQLSSFSGKIDGELNEERERAARDLRERIMSGQM
jgi:hypothetical protein